MTKQYVKSVALACIAASAASTAQARPGSALSPALDGAQSPVVLVQAKRQQIRDMKLRLRDRGFRHISFTNRKGPYVAEACRDGELIELRIGRKGRVKDRKTIGVCGRSKRFGFGTGFPKKLRKLGYRRINPIFDSRTKTVFEACKDGKLHTILVNPNGRIERELKRKRNCGRKRVAKLPAGKRALAPNKIRDYLEKRRYHTVKVIENDGDFAMVEACRRNRRFRVRINRAARKVVGRKRVGWCDAGGRKFAKAPAPAFKIDSDQKIDAEQCQDAFEYLLDKDKVYFETASADIGRRSEPLLKRVARIAKRCPGSTLVIGGHTDSVGSSGSNQVLSEDRALSVVKYLRRRGIAGDRVSGIGYGESRPVAPNSNEDGRALNRRIEILVEWES